MWKAELLLVIQGCSDAKIPTVFEIIFKFGEVDAKFIEICKNLL